MFNKTVLITGSTSGIGKELAAHYLAAGWRVITHGRTAAPFPGQELAHLEMDLAQDGIGARILEKLTALGVTSLDLLINNAALAHYGPTQDHPAEGIRSLVAVNLVAPLSLTWHLFPLLRAAGGTVVYVSSVAAALATPQYAVYSATKAALDGFVRSFRQEAHGTGVSVRLVHPAGTMTAMHQRSGFPTEKLKRMKFSSAETVARQIVGKLYQRQDGPLTLGMRAACFLCKKMPHLVDRLIARSEKAPWHGKSSPPGLTVVTGTSSGIGQALATQVAPLLGIDLQAGAGVVQADLADFTQLQQAAEILAGGHPIQTAFWNAGVNATGRFWEIPWSRQEKLLLLNFLAPLVLSSRLLRAQPQAAQVFIASLSHHLSYPGASSYAATKDGVAHYARSLRCGGTRALTIFPGPTDTPHAAQHSPTAPEQGKPTRRMAPAVLAHAIHQAVAKGAATLVPGTANKVLSLLGHWMPSLAELAMRKALWEKMTPGRTT